MAKRMIRLFGFTVHDAPGEAEAECALLQQQGIVDAVLSEDVDTIMFGCRRTLRNWTAEGSKSTPTPTHVSVYEVTADSDSDTERRSISGLDREGMVLVALMSGGDYLPEGVPGCGVKVACEAARAGFGRELCRIRGTDKEAFDAWRERLLHELRTNESGFFRTRHKALEIPADFPSVEILRYYTHPVVSRQATVDKLREKFPTKQTVDVIGLREFVRETLDWGYRGGALAYIRVLAPSLLVQMLLERSRSPGAQHDDLKRKKKEEAALVRAISTKRAHFSTDATPELRASFIPNDIVGLELDDEPEEEIEEHGRTGIALNSDDEFDEVAEGVDGEQPSRKRKAFDPLQPSLVWVPESLLKLGVPLTVEDWEQKQRAKEVREAEKQRAKEERAAAKAAGTTVTRARTTRSKKTDMPTGALDKFVRTSKPAAVVSASAKLAASVHMRSPSPPGSIPSATAAGPTTERSSGKQPSKPSKTSLPPASKKPTTPSKSKPKKQTQPSPMAGIINPWTLAGSQVSPRVTKFSSTTNARKSDASSEAYGDSPHGFLSPSPRPQQKVQHKQQQEPILIESSPLAAPPTPRSRKSSPSSPNRQVSAQINPAAAYEPGLSGGSVSRVMAGSTITPIKKPSKRVMTPASEETYGYRFVNPGPDPFSETDEEDEFPSMDLSGSTPSRPKSRSPAGDAPQKDNTQTKAHSLQPPSTSASSNIAPKPERKARPFKRSKSGAEDRSQKSITDFGFRVPTKPALGDTGESQVNSKASDSSKAVDKAKAPAPIEISLLSSDDEDDLPASRPTARSKTVGVSDTHGREGSTRPALATSNSAPSIAAQQTRSFHARLRSSLVDGLDDDDDNPFASPAVARRRSGLCNSSSTTANNSNTTLETTAATTTRTIMRAATTTTTRTYYIPRLNSRTGEMEGYFDTVELGEDEDSFMSSDPDSPHHSSTSTTTAKIMLGSMAARTKQRRRRRWRLDEIAVVDLTAQD